MKQLFTAVAAVLLAACSAGSGAVDAGGSGGGGGTGGGSAGGAGGGTGGGSVDAGNPGCLNDGGLTGPSKCGCPGFTFCEDFEGTAIDPTRWMLQSNNLGTAVLDATKSARGGKSLHVTVKSSAGSTMLLNTTRPFPAANNSFFGRAFVFAQAPIPTVHAGMFAAIGGNTEVRLGLDHNGDIEPNYMSPPNEYGIFTSNKSKMPTGTWSCLEWEYRGTGELHFFLNGSEMTQIEVLSTKSPPWTAPTYTKFSLGMILFQSDTATATSFDVWFDEVAFSTTRVGCSN